MSVSILTYWGVPNYGAYAQAYALNAVIRKLGCQTEHISYLHPLHHQLYAPPSLFSCLKFRHPKKAIGHFRDYFARRSYNWKFVEDQHYIPHTKRMSSQELSERRFDCIVTGSDAIWEFSIPAFGNDGFLIGNNLHCSKLVAYATSFGKMSPRDAFPTFVPTGLKKYDSIAVRDENSANIVEKLIGIRPPVVLDPTLLWDFSNDSNIPKTDNRDYILVYTAGFDDKTVCQLKEYASRHHLKLIGAGLSQPWCDYNISPLNPMEWIGLFENAHCVATSTFHGLMFALNYKRPLIFRMVPYVRNRCSWLLKQLGIYTKFKCSSTPVDELLMHNLNYDIIGKKLGEMQEYSIEYLRSAVMEK